MQTAKQLDTIDLKVDLESEPIIFKRQIGLLIAKKAQAEVLNFFECNQENENRGSNWWYTVEKEKTFFKSILFLSGDGLDNLPNLKKCFTSLFETYQKYGLIPIDSTFNEMRSPTSDDMVAINPIVFYYPAGTGIFDWHSHDPEYQQFQLLANITQPEIDYLGGETQILMPNESCHAFDHNFEMGDVFSFPYSYPHRVLPVKLSTSYASGASARISVLMPIHPRSKYTTTFLSELEDPC